MSLPPLLDVIAQYGLHPNKKLGQHFLTDPHLLEDIVRTAHMPQGAHIIEIGPGPGGLTRAILQDIRLATLTVIELDKRCIAALKDLQGSDERLHIVEGDALKQHLLTLTSKPRAIIANLPYNVGTTMVIDWLKLIHEHPTSAFDSITVMLQKEVIERMCASAGSKSYGKLSILCQWLCNTDFCFDVAPHHFTPPPKVMSAIVRLSPKKKAAFHAPFDAVMHLLNCAFSQRRKMLRSSLKSYTQDPVTLLESCNINPTLRAENLSLKDIEKIVTYSGIEE